MNSFVYASDNLESSIDEEGPNVDFIIFNLILDCIPDCFNICLEKDGNLLCKIDISTRGREYSLRGRYVQVTIAVNCW